MITNRNPELNEHYMRATFDAVPSFTVGAEEELLLVHPSTGMPMPAIELALALFDGDPRVVAEFRATQVEIVSPVCVAVADVARELASTRRLLSSRLAPNARALAVGAHPTAADPGPISERPRYAAIAEAYPWAARHMLTSGLHVHVAVGGADRALAVHNAMRSYLPEIIALGANSPFHAGADTGLATVRTLLNRTLPRFGAPPAFATWSEFADFLAWGERSSTIPDLGCLWWDMRLHPGTGTLEIRAADVQTRVADSAALIALIQCLAYDLAGRYDEGELLPVHDRDRIGEAMSMAARDGLAGSLPDLGQGELSPTSERVLALADRLRPAAWALGCVTELEHVEALVLDGGGARRQREIAALSGIDGLVFRLSSETAGDDVAEDARLTAA
jgi:carboxylate-amine ligase